MYDVLADVASVLKSLTLNIESQFNAGVTAALEARFGAVHTFRRPLDCGSGGVDHQPPCVPALSRLFTARPAARPDGRTRANGGRAPVPNSNLAFGLAAKIDVGYWRVINFFF
ncbi:hypothetical protein EVAR_16153_1 [Eumeta japonica]|uniref:Uncharacterized protein n=1 Tax=Eumeta variegata TaxID=151549 RepID=A0A4C1WE83_EUMVA|nr:hypothetical protein EVAR_16153_1 [Eumeta japonica]